MQIKNYGVLEKAIILADEKLQSLEEIETRFGMQNPKAGYELQTIRFLNENHRIVLEFFMHDRKIRQEDTDVRMGDIAEIWVVNGKAYTRKEWCEACSKADYKVAE